MPENLEVLHAIDEPKVAEDGRMPENPQVLHEIHNPKVDSKVPNVSAMPGAKLNPKLTAKHEQVHDEMRSEYGLMPENPHVDEMKDEELTKTLYVMLSTLFDDELDVPQVMSNKNLGEEREVDKPKMLTRKVDDDGGIPEEDKLMNYDLAHAEVDEIKDEGLNAISSKVPDVAPAMPGAERTAKHEEVNNHKRSGSKLDEDGRMPENLEVLHAIDEPKVAEDGRMPENPQVLHEIHNPKVDSKVP